MLEKVNITKVETPYKNMDSTQRPRHESPSSNSNEKSQIDEIHEFIDECNEELKSIDQVVKF